MKLRWTSCPDNLSFITAWKHNSFAQDHLHVGARVIGCLVSLLLCSQVVEESLRGQGIGKDLMHEAMKRAVHVWKAGAMYTHVEADNEVRCCVMLGGYSNADRMASKYCGGHVPLRLLGMTIMLCNRSNVSGLPSLLILPLQ